MNQPVMKKPATNKSLLAAWLSGLMEKFSALRGAQAKSSQYRPGTAQRHYRTGATGHQTRNPAGTKLARKAAKGQLTLRHF